MGNLTMAPEKNEQGKILLQIARTAICHALHMPSSATVAIDRDAAWLSQPGATFVTLTYKGQLRGCVGSLLACESLTEDVSSNAISAALRDTRFPPLTEDELDEISVEVSLLSELHPLDFVNEQEAITKLRPGIDGIVFEYGPYRSTFLPQVWENLPQPQLFLRELKTKAGLSEDFWAGNIKLSRYTVNKWRETDFSKEHANG